MSFYLVDKDTRKKEFVNLRMEKELLSKIKEKAQERGTSLSESIRETLNDALKTEETQ